MHTKTDVLLIEDDAAFGQLVAAQLGPGYLTVRKPTLAAGLAALDEDDLAYDIVLLDLTLPDSEAPQTMHHFFERHGDLACLIVSNHSDENLILTAIQHGAQGYLVKQHLNPDWLKAAIFQAIYLKRAERHYRTQLRSISGELYETWESETGRLYRLANGISDKEIVAQIYEAADNVSTSLARLVQFIAPEIRES